MHIFFPEYFEYLVPAKVQKGKILGIIRELFYVENKGLMITMGHT